MYSVALTFTAMLWRQAFNEDVFWAYALGYNSKRRKRSHGCRQ